MDETGPKKPFIRKILGFRSGKPWKMVIASISYLFILFMIIGIANSGNSSKTTSPTTTSPASNQVQPPKVIETIKITSPSLYAAYNANEVAADTKYKGKMLEVSGTVDDVKKDILDTMYVTLQSDEMFGSIQCYFDNQHTSQLASLKKGQQLTITGKCDGYSIMNVLVKNCEIK
jgi:RecG-like helicase